MITGVLHHLPEDIDEKDRQKIVDKVTKVHHGKRLYAVDYKVSLDKGRSVSYLKTKPKYY